MTYPWYKTAIFYSLDVETFMDADGNGIGDFAGLIQRLDYLKDLGIDCLWLLPFYPSPNRDDGYDIIDYYSIDPRLGTLDEFVQFTRKAKELNIRIIIDLVVNHTSIQHPWFQEARSNPDSNYRNYYVWVKEPPEHSQDDLIFPGVQESIWEYDQEAKSYYLHRFYKEQPDLNVSNPDVQAEIFHIMRFWLERGISGFRVDAAPFLIEPLGVPEEQRHNLEDLFVKMRKLVCEYQEDGILLAEANVKPDKLSIYFGEGNKMQMLFDFWLNQHLFLALAKQDTTPIYEGLKQVPEIPQDSQWVNFLRHHDELTLDQLSKDEQKTVFATFAPEPNMQIYGHGIRRRLAPILGGNRQYLELVYSLLFSLPGTPLIRYGAEIGMGDDLSLEGRLSVRTPMQWANQKNGGFSTADEAALPHPVIHWGDFSYEKVNVENQQIQPDSLLNWMKRVIKIRKQFTFFGGGKWQLLETQNSKVLAHCCYGDGQGIIAVHNLANQSCNIHLEIPGFEFQFKTKLLSDRTSKLKQQNSSSIELSPYGYCWFQVEINESISS